MQFRALFAEGVVAFARIDDLARRQYKLSLIDGVEGITLNLAAHAAGIVSEDATDTSRCGRAGIRSEHVAVASQDRLSVAKHNARQRTKAFAAVEDLHAGEVGLHIDEDVVRHRLAVKRRPGGAERQRPTCTAGIAHQRGKVLRVAWLNDHGRDVAVRRSV